MDWTKFYEQCWDILVEHAGADAADNAKVSFVQSCLREGRYPLVEYRFCGKLGFGGKFWRYGGNVYVSCYSEDKTPERDAIIKKTNEALQLITPEGGVHGPPEDHQRWVNRWWRDDV